MVGGEKEVESSVIGYLRNEGYTCFYDFDRNRGKFAVYDQHTAEKNIVDIVAYKWDERGQVLTEIVGIECKDKGTYASIQSALEQAKVYRKHIPWCYIATRRGEIAPSLMDSIKKIEGIGYIGVGANGIDPEISQERDYLNPYLNQRNFEAVRQKVVMYDTLKCLFPTMNLNVGFGFNGMWAYAEESMLQYMINDLSASNSVSFGITLERRGVRELLKDKFEKLQQLVANDEWSTYSIDASIKRFRTRQDMQMTVLRKACPQFSQEDAKMLERVSEEHDYGMHIGLGTTVWRQDEFFSRENHLSQLGKVKAYLESLGHDMGWYGP